MNQHKIQLKMLLSFCGLVLFVFCGSRAEELNEEGDVQNHPHSRQKRFIYFNTQSPVDIGLLITLPLSFALPTFNLKTSRRFSRSINGDVNDIMANLTTEDILPIDSYDEPAYSVELGKMLTYFTILEVDEDICQRRMICDIFTDAEKFRPISDIFGRKLSVDRGTVPEKMSSRYYRFLRAMQEGISGGETGCKKQYGKCPYSAEERLNMPALHFWTYLTNILRMEFRDE